jgi:hypothetical protein
MSAPTIRSIETPKGEVLRNHDNRSILVCVVSVALFGILAPVGATNALPETDPVSTPSAAPPDCSGSWRAARLHCSKNATGLVTGNYGGTDFFLTCDSSSSARFCTAGNDFRYIMEGATPGGPFVRCALSGSSGQVNEKCGPLHLSIN